VLAFDPDNAAVHAALGRLEGRARARKAALVLSGAVALGGVLVGVGRMATRPSSKPSNDLAAERAPAQMPAQPPKPVVAAPVVPPETKPTAEETPHTVIRGSGTRTRGTGAREAREAGANGVTRTFTLGPTPQNVDVYLDGKKQFAYDPDHKTLTVPWNDNHVVEFRSPAGCCFVERIEVGPDRPLPPEAIIARRLKWRPASLHITTEPAAAKGTRIMVRDPSRSGTGTLARTGEEVDVPFSSDDEGSKEIEIAIDTGDAFTSERITVRAGQKLAHVVKLKTSN
jgi:hypothetical protein